MDRPSPPPMAPGDRPSPHCGTQPAWIVPRDGRRLPHIAVGRPGGLWGEAGSPGDSAVRPRVVRRLRLAPVLLHRSLWTRGAVALRAPTRRERHGLGHKNSLSDTPSGASSAHPVLPADATFRGRGTTQHSRESFLLVARGGVVELCL